MGESEKTISVTTSRVSPRSLRPWDKNFVVFDLFTNSPIHLLTRSCPMPSRPLFWLTLFFMLGILADRLFGESLPVPTHYFVFAAVILIAAMVISLWPRNLFAKWFRLQPMIRLKALKPSVFLSLQPDFLSPSSSVVRTFAIPALLFFIFGMWASKATAPQFPHSLEPYLKGKPATFIAEVTGSPEYVRQQTGSKKVVEASTSPEYYPDNIRIPLRLLCAITGDGQTPLDGGVLLSLSIKDPTNPGASFLPPPEAAANRAGGLIAPPSKAAAYEAGGPTAPPPKAGVNPAGGPTAPPPEVAANRAGGPTAFFLPGDRVLFRAALKRFRSFRNPGGFDYVHYQAEKGLYAHCFLKDERFLIKLEPASGTSFGDPGDVGRVSVLRYPFSVLRSIRGRIELFRQKTLLWAQRSMDPEPAAFYAAMILGYKMLLDRNWQDHIHQTGLNHLLSVSGLHIGMVSMFMFWLVRFSVRFLCPSILSRISDKQIAIWPALACAVLYAFLAGFGAPTIWRSVLTLAVFLLAGFRYRKADSLTVLAFAALCILALDPKNLWQIPFQLTFACVFAIIVIYPRFSGMRLHRIFPALKPDGVPGRIIAQFEDAFWVSIAINIVLIPLIIFYFDGFALIGVVANIFLVPYIGFVVLPLGLLSVLLFAFSQTLAYPVIFIVNYLLWGCLRVIEWFAGFSWSYFWTGSISPVWLFVVYACLGLFLAPFARKLKVAGLVAMGALICGGLALGNLTGSGDTGALRVDIIDVGQGTSNLVRFPTGETMVVDGGGIPDESYDIGRQVLAPFLWHEGIRRLDYVALSHDHPDHGLGLRFILRNFDVGSFWTSGITLDDQKGRGINSHQEEGRTVHSHLGEIALKRNIKIRTFPDLFKDVQIGQARIRLLHPTGDFLEKESRNDLNKFSLVFDITQGIYVASICLIT
ncbi:MAG: ComEC/Rec2 family competence protein [Syntrophobacteraceae bacterium]